MGLAQVNFSLTLTLALHNMSTFTPTINICILTLNSSSTATAISGDTGPCEAKTDRRDSWEGDRREQFFVCPANPVNARERNSKKAKLIGFLPYPAMIREEFTNTRQKCEVE